jgi:hypothetical protein
MDYVRAYLIAPCALPFATVQKVVKGRVETWRYTCASRWWYENTCGQYVLYARRTMTSCTVVARAKIRTAGAAGWDRSPAYLPILACLAGSVLLHACMRRPVSRSGLLGEPVDGSIGVGDDGWPSSTRRPLRTYAVPLSSAYPPASSPAATKLRMLVLCLGRRAAPSHACRCTWCLPSDDPRSHVSRACHSNFLRL